MTDTGMTRHVDELGRIVLPIQIRRTLGLRDGAKLDIHVQDGRVVLEPHNDLCVFCASKAGLREFRERSVCKTCAQELNESANWDPFSSGP